VRKIPLTAGILALLLAWSGLASHFLSPFTAHMIMHMLVVAVAAPLLALTVIGTRFDFSLNSSFLFAPLTASLTEFVAIWGWHAPALHHWARGSVVGLVLEQSSFLLVGFVLWLSCLGRNGRTAGVLGLLFTSMHMTLLGALLALANRPLYSHVHDHGGGALNALEDQNIGGLVMLGVGGAAYLIGGLALMARLLNAPAQIGRS
jgi:putative membrane protein